MRDALTGSWYLLVTCVIGIAWASVLLSLLATGVGTLVIVVGAFVLIATTQLVHLVEDAEVRRAARFLHTEVPPSASNRAAGPSPATLPARLRHEWTPQTQRRALAGLARMITGPVLFTATVVLWVAPLGLLSTPVLAATGLEPTEWTQHIESVVDVAEWPAAIAMSVAGLLLLPVAAVALRRLATVLAERTLAVAVEDREHTDA